MKRAKSITNWVLKALGTLLIVAAALKAHQLLTEPLANKDIWSYRPVLILLVECELALGLWLISGLLPRLAWLTALACFSFFCVVTLYKALTGAASCGCFGSVSVNPWITLLAIDLPAVIGLFCLGPQAATGVISPTHLRTTTTMGVIAALGVAAGVVLAACGHTRLPVDGLTIDVNAIRSRYVLLDPESWVGRPLPVLEYIDIGDRLRQGRWLLILRRQGCVDCQRTMAHYRDIVEELTQRNAQLAVITMPPHDADATVQNPLYSTGRLSSARKWVVMTPAMILMNEGRVVFGTEGRVPDPETLREFLSRMPHVDSALAPVARAPDGKGL